MKIIMNLLKICIKYIFKLFESFIIIEALVAQSVERQAVNLQVDCSNQSWGEFFLLFKFLINF